MGEPLRIVLLTSDSRRHRYVASRLGERFSIAGILTEAKPASAEPKPESGEDRETLRTHFLARDEAERRLLGEPAFPAGAPILPVPAGGSNTLAALDWLRGLAPHAVVLYGTSIIREPILGHFENRVVNMHLGLSPYYRGSGTNFWPLVDRRPECVGVTIHLATLKVDGGPILGQVRPPVAEGDGAHDLGSRAIVAGVLRLIESVERYVAGTLRPIAQATTGGRLCRRKDFNAAAVRLLEQQVRSGMIAEYVRSKAERDRQFPIIEKAE